MSLTRITFLAASLIFSCDASAQSSDMETMQKSLKPWQPKEITSNNEAINILMNEKQISPEVYSIVVTAGICPSLWFQGEKGMFMKSLKEVRILNQFGAIGYVLENPHATCTEIGKAQPNEANTILLSNTHMHH